MEQKFFNLTNPQKSIWNMEKFFEGTAINNICTPAIIYEKIDENLLKQAINNVVKNNDSFRIQIELKNGVPMQKFSEFKPFDIGVINIKDELELTEIEQKEVNYKFNIINSCLFRFKIAIFENGFGAIVLTVHHLIADSWSLGLVIKKILAEYHALKDGITLPETTTSYIDYINSEQNYKQSKKYELDKTYWDEVFKTIPEQASLPSLKKTSSKISCNARRSSFSMDSSIMQKIISFCASNKISIFNFLMAIYSVYIAKVSNLNDFVIGTPILNRVNFNEKQTMGMFVNTVPVRISMPECEKFSDFSRSLSTNMVSILKHQKYSYSQILEDLRAQNNNVPNLYNIAISYQITKAFSEGYGNYKTDWVFNNYCSNDLNIHIADLNDTGKLIVSYDYLTDKYDLKYIQDLHARILYMIDQVINDENILTNNIEIVTEEEKNRILYNFNNTVTKYPENNNILDLFEEQVEKKPNNVAVVFEGKKLTYKELNEKSNSLAYYLKSKGISNNDVICISLNRCFELIIAIYAVIKSGASYVLIDPSLPQERIAYIVSDSKAKYCIINNLSKSSITIDNSINIDDFDFTNYSTDNLQRKNTDNLCVIYTSGSTGNPKGVLLHNKGFINLIYAFDKEMEISKYKNILGIATVSFDMFAVELFSSTLLGNTLVLANEEEQKDPILMSNLIKNNNVEFLVTTPSRIELLLLEECQNPLENVKAFQLGGEEFTTSLYNRLHAVTNAKIFNGYGPTEITACCTNKLVTKNDVTIGKPISNVQVYICDSNMNLLPIGVVGEICVAGIGVANGYLNNEASTSIKFVKNPFSNGYIYKTGDLGRFKDNGDIEYIGRSDFQVKLRGLRIELGEIENRICEIPSIKSCVVVKKANSSHEFLCAYFTADSSIDTAIIRKHLEGFLPKYMIPQYFMQMGSLPHTPNGKIDRKNLPEPQYQENNKEIVLPRNDVDAKLIDMIKDLLNVDSVSLDDSFFELGGDSLSAINLGVKIQNEFNSKILVKDILESSNIQNLSDMIIANANIIKKQTISRVSEAEFYDVSFAQKRIYLASTVSGASSTLYNVPGGVILDGYIDTKKLEKCFISLINRHETLRTYFELNNNNVVQKVLKNTNFKLDVLSDANFDDLHLLFEDFVKPFDLSKAPLLRVKFIKFTNGKSAIFLDMHHIISDGTSMAILVDELCKLYNGETLPELNISYKDFANFENKRFISGELLDAEKYWLNQFNDEIPVLNLCQTHARPSVQSFEGKKVYSFLDEITTKKIEKLAEELGVTPYMLLLSSYYILLSKYTSQNDIVVGSPVVGRDIADTYNLIGMFVNTLALREKIDSSVSFKDFVLSVKNNLLKAYEYQTYPFDELVNKLNIKRDTSRNSLFDTMFIYQNNGYKDLNFKGIKSEYYVPDTNISKFDLSLEALPEREGIKLSFEYATKLFDEEFIESLSTHYLNILKVILENVDTKIADIDMLSNEEKNKILYEFNNTKVGYPKNKTIVDLFEEQAQKTPNNIAVVFENKQLTYKELNEKANSLAHYLRNNGIGRNDLVGIMVNRSLEMITSILAVLKAGGAYIPIDPTYPKDRIEYMLNSSSSKMLLTQKHLENKINFENKLLVDFSNNSIYGLATENLQNINYPEDLSYVIFTSGSTGLPKGVMLTHKALSNLTNYCNNYVEYLKNPTYQAVVSITTMSFDIFIFETLISIQKGLKLIIANEDEQNIPKLLNALIEKHDIKIIQATPSRMQIFINNINDIPALKNLKYITLAGEQLPLNLVHALHNLCGATVYNGYGPSETTVFSTLTKMDGEFVTIGKPLDNTQIYILDNNLTPVPMGVSGEIYISGDGVGKGYLNNVELTAKSFIQNPFIANTIMYKTGDLGMYLTDGNILCLGRSDNQVKIRGQRIELSEIEDKISEIRSINSCVVVKKVDEFSREFLCAYFTTDENIDVTIIRKHLEKFLPKYMIPQYFMQMESLPHTPNGKIDRRKLPAPNYENAKSEIILPRNEIDAKLIEILRELLRVDSISIDDSFFELGGDSLSAINLCAKVQKELNCQIFVRNIMEHPCVKDLSDLISANNDKAENLVIPKVSKAEFYPVSSSQKRMYFVSQVAGSNSILYNIPCSVIFDGIIDSKKLENCFISLINRHEALRTYFEVNNNNVVQKVLENTNFKLDILNAADFDNLHLLFEDFVKPFDLTKAPLFRVKFITFTNGKSAIFLDIHHIISDGTSMSILVDELCKLYNDKTLPELNITYKDFAVFENEKLNSGQLKNAENYWISQFAGEIPVLNLPIKHSRPAVQSFEGKRVYSLINEANTKKIEKLAEELGVTPYMLLLSSYYILLSKYTSQDDIVVGSPVVGRDIADTYSLIGMFVNTLALREKIDSNMSFKDFVLSVKNNLLKAYEYQTYPFDELVNKLNIKRDTSRNPLFDTMFIYQNNGLRDLEVNGIKANYYIPDANISKFDLSLEAVPGHEGIKLTFEYATKLFDEEFIKTLSTHYLNILNSILENIDTKIADIGMLSKDEENKILYEFNNTKVNYIYKSISILFEEQAQNTPNNIAVVFGEQKLTYKELNERANSLAHYLRSSGIGRNDLVGIMVSRSLEMIVCILAVIKAGAAYIPIDPSYPKDRVDYMLDSSNAIILLTQKHLAEKINFENKVFIDLNNDEIYSLPNNNLENVNEPEDLVYCIFTSGSTGKPKGVMITHKVLSNFTNYCNNYVDYLKNPVYRGIISITTISFDIFAYETIISLQKGLKVIIANENEQTTPKLLNDLIEKNDAEIIQSTPSIMQIFVSNIDDMPSLKKLKYVTLAGEQLPLSLVHSLHNLCSAIVYNGYGPSETYYCSLTEMNDKIITIGKPIYNSQMYILDKNLKPVPIGVFGEIYISGDCVGKGYLNNAELTTKSFIKNPYLPGTTMYKSGDLGTYTTDGDIICLGRSDHQIKIRGLRIELGEIESLIEQYPNIEKVTVVKQSINNREFISAYFVARKRIVINELRKYLSKSLPKYMVPSYYVPLNDFPYTPNGKIDKNALPSPSSLLNSEEYVAPKTEMQKQIVSIWEKVLNIKPIGINDNFFELGGDSLLAMNLNIELLKISSKIKYSDIFRFPTIAELDEKLNSNEDKPVFSKIENISDSCVAVLKNCTKKEKINTWHPRNVLLTGATGFLGIHILQEFIENESGKIFCIIREEPGLTARTKILQKLNYYFGNKYNSLVDNRIIAVAGSITEPNFGINGEDLLELANSIDVVINSAANVSHFGNYKDFYNTNVMSVKHIINFCNNFNKKFYHVSTTGVAGTKLDSSYLSFSNKRHKESGNVEFDESCLYIGQILDNVYTRSKFEAESYILDAINTGLDAYILRIGHLMPRYRDGIFQENVLDNEFVEKCISFIRIGAIPDYILNILIDVTPVDYAAKAIYKLLIHPTSKNRVFHIYNHKMVSIARYLKIFKKINYNIEILPENNFKNKINSILHDENSKHLLNNLMKDFDNNLHLDYDSDIIMKSRFTIKYLKQIHFKWPRICNKYLISFINLLRKVL